MLESIRAPKPAILIQLKQINEKLKQIMNFNILKLAKHSNFYSTKSHKVLYNPYSNITTKSKTQLHFTHHN